MEIRFSDRTGKSNTFYMFAERQSSLRNSTNDVETDLLVKLDASGSSGEKHTSTDKQSLPLSLLTFP